MAASKNETDTILLRWSDHVPSTDVQDPLGLGLRGSARLASRLLYCITSITRRARYFSFIPWCIYNFRRYEKGKPFATGLRDAIVIREQALTLGCVAHHGGQPCAGGSLVGSRDARKWYANNGMKANFRKMKRFSKNPALDVYLNSLVNLGLFTIEEVRPDSDEEDAGEGVAFNDLDLSPLGLDLAKRYDSSVGRLAAVRQISDRDRVCSLQALGELGSRGGLCELVGADSEDRALLRDVFFAKVETKGESHRIRRQSLLLIMELCRQMCAERWMFSEATFGGAVYYGEVANGKERMTAVIPHHLRGIAVRWRMFYFHHYMSVAFEGLFAWLVTQLGSYGLSGTTRDSLIEHLAGNAVRREISEILHLKLTGSLSQSTPAELFAKAGIRGDLFDKLTSESIDKLMRSETPFAEDTIESLIRSNAHLYSATGLVLPMVLLMLTLARYARWDETNYGKWLASAADDGYLDLVPPLVAVGLTRRFGKWWNASWTDLTSFVLSRYVIDQHQTMSYEKTWDGERCLLQLDGARIASTGSFEKIGMGNPRLSSATQVLVDLGLIELDSAKVTGLTEDGKAFLKREMKWEIAHEVS